jgi:uncharacterized protein (TIGR04222 family)
MNPEQTVLWKRIQAFRFDEPGIELHFAARLARENGWGADYARRVVEEYRRFMFLAAAAGHPVTPSDEVDQAWHLHMTYTRSYWERFCGETLGKRIHHEPTRGGLREGMKFEADYERTRASYRRFFEGDPPADVWPAPRTRFGPESRGRRLDVDRYVLLSKGALLLAGLLLLAAATALCLFRFRSPVASAFERAMDLRGPEFLGFFALLFGTVLALGLGFRRLLRAPDDEPAPRELDLDPYEIAYLAGGEPRAIQAALAGLVQSGVAGAVPGERRLTRLEDPGGDAHPLKRVLLPAACMDLKAGTLKSAAEVELGKLRDRLTDLGLWVAGGRDALARFVCSVAVLTTLGVGLSKVLTGLERGRPVLILGAFLAAAGAAAFVLLLRGLGRTRRGDRALARLKHEHRHLGAKSELRTLTREEVPTAAGLFGLGVLLGGPFDPLHLAMTPSSLKPRSDGGCGAGGCGGDGGGCGGGCGGCGGCGG